MATGRPTKYQKEFHNADFIRLSKQGKSISEIALEWDIDRVTIYNWGNRYREFLHTIKKGRDFCEAWYINLGRLAMLGQAKVDGKLVKLDVGLFCWLTK